MKKQEAGLSKERFIYNQNLKKYMVFDDVIIKLTIVLKALRKETDQLEAGVLKKPEDLKIRWQSYKEKTATLFFEGRTNIKDKLGDYIAIIKDITAILKVIKTDDKQTKSIIRNLTESMRVIRFLHSWIYSTNIVYALLKSKGKVNAENIIKKYIQSIDGVLLNIDKSLVLLRDRLTLLSKQPPAEAKITSVNELIVRKNLRNFFNRIGVFGVTSSVQIKRVPGEFLRENLKRAGLARLRLETNPEKIQRFNTIQEIGKFREHDILLNGGRSVVDLCKFSLSEAYGTDRYGNQGTVVLTVVFNKQYSSLIYHYTLDKGWEELHRLVFERFAPQLMRRIAAKG